MSSSLPSPPICRAHRHHLWRTLLNSSTIYIMNHIMHLIPLLKVGMYFIKTHALIPVNYITVISVCCGMSINVCRTLESLKPVIEQIIWNLYDADSSEEAEQLREAVLSGRVRLQQAELEAEQWKEELRRLQTHNCEQSQQIQQLRQDRQNSQEHNNRSGKPYEEQLHVKKAVSYEQFLIVVIGSRVWDERSERL